MENANILFDGNLIERVSTDAIEAEDALIIDGRGHTLMPSLIDSHLHLAVYTPISLEARQNIDEFMARTWWPPGGQAPCQPKRACNSPSSASIWSTSTT